MHRPNPKNTLTRGSLAMANRVGLFGLVITLAGCEVGPNFSLPGAHIESNWTQASGQASSAQVRQRWWEVFRDPTLNKLIQLAAAQNLTVQVAGLRIIEARAELGIANTLLYPESGISGDATKNYLSNNVANSALVPDTSFETYSAAFDSNWELDVWGRGRRTIEAADARLLESLANYDDAVVSLTAEVARTYATIREFQTLIALARENVAIQEDGLNIATARFEHGATSQLDVDQQTQLLESTRASIPEFETGLERAKNALSVLLGQPPGSVNGLIGGSRGIPSAPSRVGVGLPAEMLSRRPDIRAAEYRAAAASARIGIAKSEYFPAFFLSGDIGLSSSNAGDLTSNGSNFGSFGAGFRWSILNFERIGNTVRANDANFQATIAEYEEAVLRAAQEVEDAMVGYVKTQQSTASLQKAVDAAESAVKIATVQYQEGAENFSRVLDAQQALVQESYRLARSRTTTATDLIALYKALGGGWEVKNGKPIIPPETAAQMQARTNWGKNLSLDKTLPPVTTPFAQLAQ